MSLRFAFFAASSEMTHFPALIARPVLDLNSWERSLRRHATFLATIDTPYLLVGGVPVLTFSFALPPAPSDGGHCRE